MSENDTGEVEATTDGSVDGTEFAEFVCPIGGAPLVTRNSEADAWLFCPRGHGLALSRAALRERFPDAGEVVARVFADDDESPLSERTCPRCRLPASVRAVATADAALELDVCAACDLVWFDPAELRRLERTLAEGGEDTAVLTRLSRWVLDLF